MSLDRQLSADQQVRFGELQTFVGGIIAKFGGQYAWIGYLSMAFGAYHLKAGQRRKQHEADDAARAEAEKARAQARSYAIKQNVRGSAEGHSIVFGQVRVGGVIAIANTKLGDTRTLHMGIAHSLSHPGGCGGWAGLWVDDTKIASFSGDGLTADALVTDSAFVIGGVNTVKFRHYIGTSTQGADSTLTTDSVDGSSAYRRGIAWTRFTLTRPADEHNEAFQLAFPYGIPQLSIDLKGIKCYDPRKDSTNGGSGSHRLNDYTTWEWTRNPILCATTYAIMAQLDGGMAWPSTRVDWPSVIVSANKCDESISTPAGTQNRFYCDVVLSAADDFRTNLQRILDSCAGSAIPVGSVYKFYAGTYDAPTQTLDSSYLRGALVVRTRSELDRVYNSVNFVFDDRTLNYRPNNIPPFYNTSYITADGGMALWREMSMPAVTDPYQAQYMASMEGARSRFQKMVEAELNWKALDVECWQTVTWDIPEIGLSGTFRCISWEWTADGPRCVFQQEDSSIYALPTFQTPITPNSPSNIQEVPETPSGLTATPTVDGVILRFNRPADDVSRVQIYRSTASGGTYTLIGVANDVQWLDPTHDGATWYYKIKAMSITGTLSSFSSVVSATTFYSAYNGLAYPSPAILSLNRTPAVQQSGNPLTAADADSTATISIAAHTLQVGYGTINYSAGSITGLGFSTTYYVYADDPTFVGGAVTYVATTSPYTPVADFDRYFLGVITTPANGGGGTGGNENCVALDSWIGEEITAGLAGAGDLVYCRNDAGAFFDGEVIDGGEVCPEACARLVSDGGAAVVVSLSTPITLSDNRRKLVSELQLEDLVATRYGAEIRFERLIRIEAAGVRMVRRMHVGGHSFAAGETPDAMIYTHNAVKP